jgi:hypothetical protein
MRLNEFLMKKPLKLILLICFPLLISVSLLFLQVEKKLVSPNFSKQLRDWYKYDGVTYQKFNNTPSEAASLKINETQAVQTQSLKINTIRIPSYFYGLDLEINRKGNIDPIGYGEIQPREEVNKNLIYPNLDIHLTDQKDSAKRSIEIDQITTVPGKISISSNEHFSIDDFSVETIQTSGKDPNFMPIIFHQDIMSTTSQSTFIKTKCELITNETQIIRTYCVFNDYAPKLHQRALLTSSLCMRREENRSNNSFCDVEKFLYHVYCKSVDQNHANREELKEIFADTICVTNDPTDPTI